jgi:lactate/malate dehydrogenase, alpha/beta C-terminal domain
VISGDKCEALCPCKLDGHQRTQQSVASSTGWVVIGYLNTAQLEVAAPLQATPSADLSQADIEALTQRTQEGGTEVVQAKAGKVRPAARRPPPVTRLRRGTARGQRRRAAPRSGSSSHPTLCCVMEMGSSPAHWPCTRSSF